MNDTIRKHIFIIASLWVLCLLALFLLYMLVLSPQQDEMAELQLKILGKKESHQNLRKAGASEVQARIRDELEQKKHKLNDFMFEADEKGKLTYMVGKISDDFTSIKAGSYTSKRLMEASVSKTEGFEHLSEERVNITFTSDFEGFARFLNTLERNQPVIFIDRFLIKPERKGAADMSVDMRLATLVEKSLSDETDAADK